MPPVPTARNHPGFGAGDPIPAFSRKGACRALKHEYKRQVLACGIGCPARDISDAALAWVVRLHSGEATTIAEGERVSVGGDGAIGNPVVQDPAIALAWQSGMYVAENRRLGDVVAALSRYHGGWIVFSHDRLKSTLVSAVLDLRTPDASLSALASGLPIRVTRMTRFVTLISAV